MTHSVEKDAPYRPRVAFTCGSIAKVVTARRRYVCGNHLSTVETHHIEPGQRYIRNSLPPHNREIGNETWWWLRVCLDCCPVEHDPRVTPPGNPPSSEAMPASGGCPMAEHAGDGTEVRLKRGMPGTYEGQTAVVRHQSPSGHSNLPRLVWLECEVIWSHGTADGFWAGRGEYVLPPAEDDAR